MKKSIDSSEHTKALPVGKDGKPLKPCCACPETRLLRDQCIMDYGESMCMEYIEAHRECLKKLGFKLYIYSTMDTVTGARFRVTGGMLPNLVGRDVSVIGTIQNVAPTGKRIRLKCADGCEIDCNLLSPLQSSLENRIIELQGRVRNPQGTELDASADFVLFPPETDEEFDMELYAQAVQMTAQFDRFYLQPVET